MQNLEDIEQLALVLMQTLDLYIEQGIGVHLDAIALEDQIAEALLVGQLDLLQAGEHTGIVSVLQQLLQLSGVLDEAVPDELFEQSTEVRIGLAQPAAVGDTVGDVEEATGLHLVIVPEDAVL